jgi:hypothetical protein
MGKISDIPDRGCPAVLKEFSRNPFKKFAIPAVSMPNSLQNPLERPRDLQRRWQWLLQRTGTPENSALIDRKLTAVPVPATATD